MSKIYTPQQHSRIQIKGTCVWIRTRLLVTEDISPPQSKSGNIPFGKSGSSVNGLEGAKPNRRNEL